MSRDRGGAREATAIAHPNIALAKYWGKRPFGHNLPAVPSLSVTLAGMATTTHVRFDSGLGADTLVLDGAPASAAATARVTTLLDRVRARAGVDERAAVVSSNDFPTAAGLASSASAFAALAVAAAAAVGASPGEAESSDLARRTSVSAARSVLGGFVELRAGAPADEVLSAESVAPPEHWDLRLVVAITREGPKDVGSTRGMQHTVDTSPYYAAWLDDAPALCARVRAAVLARDLEALGVAAEASALRMHASAIAAAPALLYWTAATVEVLAAVRSLRAGGVPAYATIDAGPHVKVITETAHEARVAEVIRATPGVLRTLSARPGRGARTVAPGAAPTGAGGEP